jgi:excisionase family DNA binding protein
MTRQVPRTQKSVPPPRLALTFEEACLAAGIGKHRLREAINTRALKSKKVGAKLLILTEDLQAWLRALPSGPGPVPRSLAPQRPVSDPSKLFIENREGVAQ